MYTYTYTLYIYAVIKHVYIHIYNVHVCRYKTCIHSHIQCTCMPFYFTQTGNNMIGVDGV